MRLPWRGWRGSLWMQFGRLERSIYLKVQSDRYNNDVRESRACRYACRANHLTAIATITLPDLWQWDLVL